MGRILVSASLRGNLESVKDLIRAGANINSTNGFGLTALMEAACGGHIEIAKELIKSGADIYIINQFEFTALIAASVYGNIEIVVIIKEQMIKDFSFLPLSHDIIRHIIMEYT